MALDIQPLRIQFKFTNEKTFPFIRLLIASFLGCSKNENPTEFCIECDITRTQTADPYLEGFDSVTTTELEQCGVTNLALDLILKNGNSTTTSTSGNTTVTIKTETTCTKR